MVYDLSIYFVEPNHKPKTSPSIMSFQAWIWLSLLHLCDSVRVMNLSNTPWLAPNNVCKSM